MIDEDLLTCSCTLLREIDQLRHLTAAEVGSEEKVEAARRAEIEESLRKGLFSLDSIALADHLPVEARKNECLICNDIERPTSSC